LPDEELRIQLDRLRTRCPHGHVDLLYFYEDAASKAPRVRYSSDGLTVVAADYRKMENGRPTQYLDLPVLTGWLHENLSVPLNSQSSDKSRVKAEMETIYALRWGPDKSRFRRWLNQRAYKLYRHLERLLQKKGLIHSEPPLYFWDDE